MSYQNSDQFLVQQLNREIWVYIEFSMHGKPGCMYVEIQILPKT